MHSVALCVDFLKGKVQICMWLYFFNSDIFWNELTLELSVKYPTENWFMPGVESHDFIPARDQRITSLECNLNSTYKDPVSQNNN